MRQKLKKKGFKNAMFIQHNLNATNANNKLGANVIGVKKSTEKLSSGFRINRAADDAAGLAISEKMRAQVRGLEQAVRNANDGISLIQTAEGALDETHILLKRIKELTVQSGNETYSDEERAYMQSEIDAIKDEVNRIAEATDFNGIKLLDGSLGGSGVGNVSSNSLFNQYGARYGISEFIPELNQQVYVASNIADVEIEFTTNASGKGGENAFWDNAGKRLTVNLSAGSPYTDAQINALIKNANIAKQNPSASANVEWKSSSGLIVASAFTTTPTVAGLRQTLEADLSPLLVRGMVNGKGTGSISSSDYIKFTANTYGSYANTPGMASQIIIQTDVGKGKEYISVEKVTDVDDGLVHWNEGVQSDSVTIHLSTGVRYSESDIENLLAKAGYDYTVEMSERFNPNADSVGTMYFNVGRRVDASDWDDYGRVGTSPVFTRIPIYEWVPGSERLGDVVMNKLLVPPVDPDGAFNFYAVNSRGETALLLDEKNDYPYSSCPSIRVNGKEWAIWNDNFGKSPLPTLELDSPTALIGGAWTTTFGLREGDLDLTVIQRISIVSNPAGVDGESYKIDYEVINNNPSAPVEFDLMYHVDTQLNDNDKAEFSVGGELIYNNRSYPNDDYSDNIGSVDIPGRVDLHYNYAKRDEPQIITGIIGVDRGSGFTFAPGSEPDRLNLGRYDQAWTWEDIESGRVGDSGYSVVWENRTAGSSSVTMTTYYGVTNPYDPDELIGGYWKQVGWREVDANDGAGLGGDTFKNSGNGLILQIGGDNREEQRVTVTIDAMTSSAIGIADINVSTVQNAQISMDKVNYAISAVSAQRASLGTMQNRLEHATSSLTTTNENINAAEAQIRDADMASMMVVYTKHQILTQSAQAMLSHAIQEPQAILQLLG